MRITSTGGLGWIVENESSCIAINPNFSSFLGSSAGSVFLTANKPFVLQFDFRKIIAAVQLSDQFQYVSPYWINRLKGSRIYTTKVTSCLDSVAKVERVEFDKKVSVGTLSFTLTGCDRGDKFWDNTGAGCIVEDSISGEIAYFQGTGGISKLVSSIRKLDSAFFTFNAFSTINRTSAYFNYYDDVEYFSKKDDSLSLLAICQQLPPSRKYFVCSAGIVSQDGEIFRASNLDYAKFLSPYMSDCSVHELKFGEIFDQSEDKITSTAMEKCDIEQYLYPNNSTKTKAFNIELVEYFLREYGKIILLTDFGRATFGLGRVGETPLSASKYVVLISTENDSENISYEFDMSLNEFRRIFDLEIDVPKLMNQYPCGIKIDHNALLLVLAGEIQFWELANSKKFTQWYVQPPKSSPVSSLFIYFQEACNRSITEINFQLRKSLLHDIISNSR